MIGLSPTRPCSFQAMPLVVQAPDRFPWASMASMPMVSWFAAPPGTPRAEAAAAPLP